MIEVLSTVIVMRIQILDLRSKIVEANSRECSRSGKQPLVARHIAGYHAGVASWLRILQKALGIRDS